MSTIKLRITRACLHRGSRVEAGAVVSMSAAEAADALASGRCELLDTADAGVVREATREAVARAILAAGRPWLTPEPASAWQRLN